MELGAAIRASSFFDEEGEELEPLTKSVCRRLAAMGIDMTGQEVRRLARKVRIPTEKVDGRIMAKEVDISKFVMGIRRHFEGKAQ